MSTVRRTDRPTSSPQLFDRAPPFDPEAEIAVLGSIMLLPEVIDDVALILRVDDFHDDAHRKIYRRMLAMRAVGRPIDPTLLVDALKTAGDYESIGGAAYLGKILHAVPSAAHAVYYAEIVREKATYRRLIETATEVLRQAYDEGTQRDGNATELANSAGLTLCALAIDRGTNHAISIGEAALNVVAEIRAAASADRKPGCYSGFPPVDNNTGAMLAGELVTIGARTGRGKSAYTAQVAEHNERRGRPVLYISLEMSATDLVRRRLSQATGIDSRDLKVGHISPAQLAEVDEEARQLHERAQSIWAPHRATIADIRGEARYAKRHRNIELLIVDYIGLIKPTADEKRMPRYELIGNFTGELKALARELQIPVIALAQLNREAESEEPDLSNLRESGSIEQDSDIVLLLHHPARRADKTPNIGPEREAHVIIAKSRSGEVGTVRLDWIPSLTMFRAPEVF